jgi:hypothetical protein
MMSANTSNRRRRAIERAVKQSQLRREAIELHISERRLEVKQEMLGLPTKINDPRLTR